jgi:hypothetical protein
VERERMKDVPKHPPEQAEDGGWKNLQRKRRLKRKRFQTDKGGGHQEFSLRGINEVSLNSTPVGDGK